MQFLIQGQIVILVDFRELMHLKLLMKFPCCPVTRNLAYLTLNTFSAYCKSLQNLYFVIIIFGWLLS